MTSLVLASLLWTLHVGARALAGESADPQPAAEATKQPAQTQVLRIDRDTVLDPATEYGPIVIAASDVTVDGRGAWIVGSREGKPKDYQGTAISAAGVSGVTLRNVNARGWETGLKITDGRDWTVENCDFSDNFHDPDFGWGENGRRGGIVAERVCKSVFRGNRANRVWDACVLVACHDNTLQDNDFSHASNTCLKLWNSCRNRVVGNDLSYGIRIKPDEVHARDSTGVLIESGSNDNHFVENDCTYGGDGIFIRVLNGWVSAGNVFRRNDCSYANNNCVEAWAPRNKYIENKANHGSYGFWLGASDQTVLLRNEASYNGDPNGNHNSPHLPEAGHAGIVFMFGPSSHTICRGNRCVGNHGAGIALLGDQASQGRKWKAFHWIIEQNKLQDNRWGVYAQYADWVNIAANTFAGNSVGDVHLAEGVTNLIRLPEDSAVSQPPVAVLQGPSSAGLGRAVVWDASNSRDPQGRPLRFRWDLGDGSVATTPRVEHRFRSPGFYRLGLTVDNGRLSDLAWRDLYVVDQGVEFGTEGQAAGWGWLDPGSRVTFANDREVRISGECSLAAHVQPYSGGRVSLLYPASKDAKWSVQGKTHLTFWIKALNKHVPAWQSTNPVVTLYESEDDYAVLTPATDLMSQRPNSEEREGWTYFAVPIAGDSQWRLKGSTPETIRYVTIGFDSWGAPPLRIWIDGLMWQ